jgi:hypothetical protein
MFRAALAVCRRVLGSAHPDTLATAESLAIVQSHMRAKQPTRRGGKPPARRKECAAASLLSATALAEAEVKAPEPFREEDLMNRTSSKKTVTTNKDNRSLNNSHVVVLEHVQHQ